MGSPAAFTFYIMQTKLIKFHETELPTFIDADGTIWVAIKPICDGIGLDYINAYKQLNSHEILSQLLSIKTMVSKDNALREMVCLPLRFAALRSGGFISTNVQS